MSREDKKAVQIAVATSIPVILKGDPGIGKTAYVQALAEWQRSKLFTIIASTHAPEDFLGLPIRTANEDVIWAPPAWGKEIVKTYEDGGKAILHLDEFSCAPPAVQAAGLRLVHERVLGELVLPKQLAIVMSMNPPETAAGGWDLEPPAANRATHVPWSVSAKEWADGIMTGFPMEDEGKPLPTDWKSHASQNMAVISSYIRAVGTEHLMNVPKDESKAGGPWPSPRTWEMTGFLWTAGEHMFPGDAVLQYTLMKNTVGEPEAIQFQEWIQNMDLPNPADLLDNPEDYVIPDRADKVAAVLSSVVSTAVADLKPKWYVSAWKLLDATAQGSHPDIAAAMARSLAQAGKKDKTLPDISQYARSFGAILQQAGIYERRNG